MKFFRRATDKQVKRILWTDAIIQFDRWWEVVLHQQLPKPCVFGAEIYHGVVPKRGLGMGLYECHVAYIELAYIGKPKD